MGDTYKKAEAILLAQYKAAWNKADKEYERYGEISEGTARKIADIELEMSLLGI